MVKITMPSDILKEAVIKASQQIYHEFRKYWLGILDEKACFEIVVASMEAFLATGKIGSYLTLQQFAKHGLRCNFDMSRKIFGDIFYKPISQLIYDGRLGQFQLIDDYDHISIEVAERNPFFKVDRDIHRCF